MLRQSLDLWLWGLNLLIYRAGTVTGPGSGAVGASEEEPCRCGQV